MVDRHGGPLACSPARLLTENKLPKNEHNLPTNKPNRPGRSERAGCVDSLLCGRYSSVDYATHNRLCWWLAASLARRGCPMTGDDITPLEQSEYYRVRAVRLILPGDADEDKRLEEAIEYGIDILDLDNQPGDDE